LRLTCGEEMKKAQRIDVTDYDASRLLNTILNLYYVEEQTQAQIAKQLGLSTAKVNRLLHSAREQGYVDITIRTPFQHLYALGTPLKAVFGLKDVLVVPSMPDETGTLLHTVGRAAASYLVEHLRNGDVIAISGGTAINAVVEALDVSRSYDVEVVPILGAVQGQVTTDMNYLASRLAARLGGKAYQLHAPAFADTREHRDVLLAMRPVKEILDIARRAKVALLGVGTVSDVTSRFVQFTALTAEDMRRIADVCHGVGEIGGQIFDIGGRYCAREYADRVIGLTLEEVRCIPFTIGVAAGAAKSLPLYGALRGGYLHSLITDEAAAQGILDRFEHNFRNYP
jgi:DNA-binding transcriptional regulator LsrR (DeoR family)